ncbi:hypothetical protein [Polynucleobacter sp. MWH-Berg-3C6]|uniref:hypothetical protein n=1 Tax=Polynucleobacter sp. MWH-Berg-3C6 TaxID=1855882 RepID=UPI001C0C36D0|nr:hypothetical protein [Polynucleobacter sp. MWH-Berg-3C6]MBU3549914.1 hypothetical protein [Polynucleobacter sp. MWH-Berg-3C6]
MEFNKVGFYWSKREFIYSLCGAFALLFWNLKNSFEFGRLAFIPTYDDVSYFLDALTRYIKFINGDIFLVFLDAVANPPHAPIIALQAIFSYMVFGVNDWAPYVTNIWILLFALLGAATVIRGIAMGRWILFLYILTAPALGAAVVEFRPDIAAGMLTAISVTMAIYGVTDKARGILIRQVTWSGLIFGCALWAKPSAFIYTLGLMTFGLILSFIFVSVNSRYFSVQSFKRAAVILAIGAVLSAPYYLLAGHRVIEYTWDAIVRDKSIWAIDMDWGTHVRFYLFGQGGRFMMGLHVWAAMLSIGIAIMCRWANPLQRIRFFILIFVILVGYIVVTVNSVKTHFLGVSFQLLLLIFSLLVFSDLMRQSKIWTIRLLMTFLVSISLLSIQPAGFWGFKNSAQTQSINNVVATVIDRLAILSNKNSHPKTVFITFTGFLNRDVLLYGLLKQGISSMKIDSWFFRPQEEDPNQVFGRAIDRADIVIAASEGASVSSSGMPSNKILPLTLSLVKHNNNFKLLEIIPAGQGNIYLYVRK